jgi:CRP/FNR family nitrogen fixation transcriptional regulator
MSVSPAVATKRGAAAFVPMPWAAPSAGSDRPELNGAIMRFAPDRQIYAEADEAQSFYKVVSGMVRTCRFLSDGRRQIDAFHGEGDVFGFEAGADHGLTAEAVSNCTVIAYRQRGLAAIVAHNDGLGRWFFSHAMTSLARAREHSLLLGRGSAAQKISAFLLEVADREACHHVVELAMSRQDIADYLGLTIETVSRTLSQMERDGTIGLPTARRVVLRDRQTLLAQIC